MAIKIYDTLSKKKLKFKPLEEKKVRFYQCGPTVYWTQHIGNMRAMVMADIVARTFRYLGYNVNFVRNYTDVGHLTSDEDTGEDKMEKGAKREGISPTEIAEKYIKIFETDLKKLNILNPTHKVRATAHIKEIIEMVKTLLEKGYAYETDLAVYFDVSKSKDYTKLSGQVLEENIEGAGSGETIDSQKKNSRDFSLWFFKAGKHKNALQTWKSPFHSPLVTEGRGFPGWHIECSAMSKKYLGSTLDLHMGGVEHIPVHHTNEIAQSEAVNEVDFVKYWLHNEHLLVGNNKMSKSEGTSYTISEIEKKGFNPLSLRYFFLQAHYRSKQNFTWEALQSSETRLQRIYEQIASFGQNKGDINSEYKEKFIEKITDDFNTPQALAIFSELLKSDLSEKDKLATILDFDKILGLKLNEASKRIENSLDTKKLPLEIISLLKKRIEARKKKNYQKSDGIRKILLEKGYKVEDKNSKTKIYKL